MNKTTNTMNDKTKQPSPLEEKNKEVHELNYTDASGSASSVKPDADHGKELATKIRENIEAYQNEVNPRTRPSLQT